MRSEEIVGYTWIDSRPRASRVNRLHRLSGLWIMSMSAALVVCSGFLAEVSADEDPKLDGPKIVTVLTDEASVLARVRIPKSVIVKAFDRDFQNTHPVDCIVLGTHSRGTAVCTGTVSCNLIENAAGAEVACFIAGTVTAQTCGTNGPATIQSRAVTTYKAIKPFFFDGVQFRTRPTAVEASTCIDVQGVGSSLPGLRGRMVRRVASKRVQQSRSAAEAVTTEITRQELCQSIDAEFDARMQEMNQKLARRLKVLTYFAGDLHPLKIRSSNAWVEITVADVDYQPKQMFGGDSPKESDAVELWIPMGTEDIASVSAFLKSAPAWLATHFSETPRLSKLTDQELEALRHQDWLVLDLQE